MKPTVITPDQSELGKKADYDPHYNPDKLFAIPRKTKRDDIGVPDVLPFVGVDIWNHYEVSWLNTKGKPLIALAEIRYDCTSPCIIESKSMKLYFNSFNNTPFDDINLLQKTIARDLSSRVGSDVTVALLPIITESHKPISTLFEGTLIDHLDIDCTDYTINPSLLSIENEIVTETLHSNLLKSNCLVTNQPDWGSVQIIYRGNKINHENLLRYLVSFRNHNEFHEQCIERIFMDIQRQCHPQALSVYGRYTRRGGLDINPYRATKNIAQPPQNIRLIRQ